MLKRIKLSHGTLILGTARDIKNLHRSILSHDTEYYSVFVDKPRFNMSKYYGLLIGNDFSITVVNSDTAISLINFG